MFNSKTEGQLNKQDFEGTQFVQIAKQLLDSSIRASGVLKLKKFDKESRENARLVLGYLNAVMKGFQTKVTYHKIMDLDAKTEAIEHKSKDL